MIELFPSYCTGSRFCAEFILKSPCWGSENVRRSIHSRRIPCKSQMRRGGFLTENQMETVLVESELTTGLPVTVQKDAFSYRKPEKVLVTIACKWLFVSICIHHCSNRAVARSHLHQADCGEHRSPILGFHFPYLSFDFSFKYACIQPAKIVGTSTVYTERTPGVFYRRRTSPHGGFCSVPWFGFSPFRRLDFPPTLSFPSCYWS